MSTLLTCLNSFVIPSPPRRTTPLKCLQINLRHSKNSLHLSQLLLDLDIDIALIQEPYAVADSVPRLKYVPDNFAELHTLSDQHAYGTAVLAKKTLNAYIVPLSVHNSVAGIKVVTDLSELYFFSIYCRPSLPNFESFLSSFFNQISPNIISKSVFCFDSNAKNQLWNSSSIDARGKTLEETLAALSITIENKNANRLTYIPSNTSFIDVTGAGAHIRIVDWHFPDFPSLSDHPYIMFSVDSILTPLS